mgnify:FL=1|jgi:hypothetical protein
MSDTENNNNMLSDNESDECDTIQKETKKKQSCGDLMEHLTRLYNELDTLDVSFTEAEKTFDKERKEYSMQRKKTKKDISQIMKKLEKTIELVKTKKKRSCSGTGGFNNKTAVPKKLCDYLDLDEDYIDSRPGIHHLLTEKFKSAGFNHGKIHKITDKNVAKMLDCDLGLTIDFREFQTFLKSFYDGTKFTSKYHALDECVSDSKESVENKPKKNKKKKNKNKHELTV